MLSRIIENLQKILSEEGELSVWVIDARSGIADEVSYGGYVTTLNGDEPDGRGDDMKIGDKYVCLTVG